MSNRPKTVSRPTSRLIATKLVMGWLTAKNSGEEWRVPSIDDVPDSFARHLIFTAIRHYSRYLFYIESLTGKPRTKLDTTAIACLLIGLAQLDDGSEVSEYAAVNETVNLAALLKKPYLKGFLNANLRGFLRRREDLNKEIQTEPAYIGTSHEDWMLDRWIHQFGFERALEIARANNLTPVLRLIVNPRTDILNVIADLTDKGFDVTEQGDGGFAVVNPAGLFETDWVKKGQLIVQDASSQAISNLVRNLRKESVLDACASPGGKTIRLEWSFKDDINTLVSCDIAEGRVKRLKSNLERAASSSKLIQMDAAQSGLKRIFDLVIVDAPCGSTGTIQKHPGIKWNRRPDDFIGNQHNQLSILNGIQSNVIQGGHLLYLTCSLENEENQDVIGLFLGQHGDTFEHIPFDEDQVEHLTEDGFFQRFPDEKGMGLFAALLCRKELTV